MEKNSNFELKKMAMHLIVGALMSGNFDVIAETLKEAFEDGSSNIN